MRPTNKFPKLPKVHYIYTLMGEESRKHGLCGQPISALVSSTLDESEVTCKKCKHKLKKRKHHHPHPTQPSPPEHLRIHEPHHHRTLEELTQYIDLFASPDETPMTEYRWSRQLAEGIWKFLELKP